MNEHIIVIGRGHSGTRAIAQTLYTSNVFMGNRLNPSADSVTGADFIYIAAKIVARHVRWKKDFDWDFNRLLATKPSDEFFNLLTKYVTESLHFDQEKGPYTGWKLPETTLCLPWLVQMFPNAKYIYWVRNPRDVITKSHKTDDLIRFGIDFPPCKDIAKVKIGAPPNELIYLRRAASVAFHESMVKLTPKPKNWIKVRMEDFILHQEQELKRLEDFLGIPLSRIIMNQKTIDRYKDHPEIPFFESLKPYMVEHGY